MISSRIRTVQNPPLVELGNFAASFPNCISLGQGAPFYHPPQDFIKAFVPQLSTSAAHRYTTDPGLIELRTALKNKLFTDQQIDISPDNIVVTPGANQAFYNILLTIADEGDEVILLTPYYFNHQMACISLNVIPVLVPLTPEFSIDHGALHQAISEKTKAIVVVNPGNPTGKVLSRSDLKAIIELAEEFNLLIIADETYEYFTFNDRSHHPLASLTSSPVISISSFSKTFGIPGWRLGYYCGPSEIINQSIKVQDTIGICAPHSSQLLGIALLEQRKSLIPEFVQLMEKNYSIAIDLLDEVSWMSNLSGGGAYYLFVKQETGLRTDKLVRQLIQDYGVYIVPGKGFGESWDDHCRLSFANVKAEQLKDAFSRLRKYQ